jgi:hypothetical protein
LLNFLQRAPGRFDRMLAQHRWFLEPGPGRPPPDSHWLDDPAMIKAIAREPTSSYESTSSRNSCA